jgi:hypothetical protein
MDKLCFVRAGGAGRWRKGEGGPLRLETFQTAI